MFIRKYVNRIFLVVAVVASSYTSAEKIRVAGTKVLIQPPSNFSASTQFSGFQHAETGSSIVIIEIPGPISEVGAGKMNAELLKEQNVKVNKMDAQLLQVRRYSGGVEFLEWMLIFGDESSSVIVVGVYPASIDNELGDLIKESVLTASWDLNAVVGYFDGLDFRVDESSELKIAKRISNTVILTREGEFGKPEAGKLVVTVGNTLAQPGNDMSIVSKQMLYQAAMLESISNIKEKKIKIGGLNAYELVADALDAEDKLPIKVYQVVIEDESSVYVIQGRVENSIFNSYISQFREITNSFTVTRK